MNFELILLSSRQSQNSLFIHESIGIRILSNVLDKSLYFSQSKKKCLDKADKYLPGRIRHIVAFQTPKQRRTKYHAFDEWKFEAF